MQISRTAAVCSATFGAVFLLLCLQPIEGDDVYIVYMGRKRFHLPHFNTELHYQMLESVLGSHEAAALAMIYSYNHSFCGFAAKLNATHANTLSIMEGVVSVFKSRVLTLHTTRSWDFMGLNLDAVKKIPPLHKHYGEGVIIGMMDSGIWPESQSFRDESLPPPPARWKGVCQTGEKFNPSNCNRKLVGARWYVKGYEEAFGPLNTTETPDYRSARDHNGHGTHTSSTAGGAVVKGASFFGLGGGDARGGAPLARLAIYKVCWDQGCTEADILAAFHDALYDGVDVISISLGGSPPLPEYFSSSSDIGSFHAMEKGISVVFAAGNGGPNPSSVTNTAPWGISVAASTIDRSFPTSILLGNNMSFKAEGINTNRPNNTFVGLVDGAYVSETGGCSIGYLPGLVAGKVVLCFGTSTSNSIYAAASVYVAGGAALIFSTIPTKFVPRVSFIPVIYVDLEQGTKIRSYYMSSIFPVVRIGPSRSVLRHAPAPAVAYFSSRGPNTLSPDILKPDITAPGVNILAAWLPVVPPSELSIDERVVDFNFLSGTSMSCPHVSGIVALLKSIHPKWSPAAIRSAIMTSAYTEDTTLEAIKSGGSGKPANPFDFGAGHVNPIQAMAPGLIYDAGPADYLVFLCSLGYTENEIRTIVSSSELNITCPKIGSAASDLNYPSIMVSNLQSLTTIKRTVANVGPDNCEYRALVFCPPGVKVTVKPNILVFRPGIKTATFSVTLKPVKQSQGVYNFGALIWSNGIHYVRSPIVVRVNNINDEYVQKNRNIHFNGADDIAAR